GLMTTKPITEDYVPLLPWFGMVLIGVAVGHWIKARAPFKDWRARSLVTKALVWGGRHSLILYLLHQPIFIGLLTLALAKPA
ncbi:MAG: heparan-alpha-glucosaminide N-acetyltransferase domain-containing protein, partial [Burkholderiales bacterium]